MTNQEKIYLQFISIFLYCINNSTISIFPFLIAANIKASLKLIYKNVINFKY